MSYTKRIVQWNEGRGLLAKFDVQKEIGYTISEDLELLEWKILASLLLAGMSQSVAADGGEARFELMKIELESIIFEAESTHDDLARWIAKWFFKHETTIGDYIDKCTDQRVFNDGGMAKAIRYIHPDISIDSVSTGIDKCLDAVMSANEAKPIGKVDEFGKQQKPEGFEKIDPKIQIEKILNGLKA